MPSLFHFLRSNPVLFLASAGALLSFWVVPPSGALLEALNVPVLAILFCLMAVIGGLRETGFFDRLLDHLLGRLQDTRQLGAVLVFACFFGSMWVTNDVALLTFVPFALLSLEGQGTEKQAARVIVLQTLAANLGSMVTPVGNPQNLYLYFRYQMDLGEFLTLLLPYTLASLVLLALGVVFWIPRRPLEKGGRGEAGQKGNRRPVREERVLGGLFLLCLLTVARIMDWRLTLGVVTLTILLYRPRWFRWVDLPLLATFVAFFVLIGNLGQVPAFRQLLIGFLEGIPHRPPGQPGDQQCAGGGTAVRVHGQRESPGAGHGHRGPGHPDRLHGQPDLLWLLRPPLSLAPGLLSEDLHPGQSGLPGGPGRDGGVRETLSPVTGGRSMGGGRNPGCVSVPGQTSAAFGFHRPSTADR